MANSGIAGAQGTSRNAANRPANGQSKAQQQTQGKAVAQNSASRSNTNLPQSSQPNNVQNGMSRAQTREMSKANTLLMDSKQLLVLDRNISTLNSFINHHYMATLNKCAVLPMESIPPDRSSIQIFELTKLMLCESENTYEKLVSLYSSLNGMHCNVGLILQSDGKGIHIYLATCCNDEGISSALLKSSVLGHFPGSELSELDDATINRIMQSIQKMPAPAVGGRQKEQKYIRSVSIVPSRREDEKENHDLQLSAQGIEKLIDGMSGHQYTVLILAEPMDPESIDNCKRGYESLFTLLSPFAKETVSYGENESDTTNYSMSVNMSETISEGISESYGTSHTTGKSGGRGGNSGSSANGNGFGFSSGSCWNSGWNTSDSTSINKGKNTNIGRQKGNGEQTGDGHTSGLNRTVTLNREIKMVQNCMQRLDAEIQRIEANRGFGMWNCCCYVIAENIDTVAMASSSLQALMAGDAAYGGNSYSNLWSCRAMENDSRNLLTNLSYMQHPFLMYQPDQDSSVDTQIISPAMMVCGKDLPTLLSLPRRSVAGLQVTTMAEFGRNFPRKFNPPAPRRIEFGNVMHMGKLENTPILFDLNTFASHSFICGASGSGKSNTTYNLLEEFHKKGIPFLVIEPAKGEYKTEFAGMPDMQVFTAKPDSYRMLALNPFEFHSNVHIKEHLAHLDSVVSTCWPLYGPMPAMLKEAFEEAYISCGWDLELSERIIDCGKEFPTFADVLPAIEKIIDESTYSNESKGDYKGALCMRVRMLMNGFEGRIFGNTRGIPDQELFDRNAIVDLSSIGNAETRSLIMGMLIIKLREYRYATQTTLNSDLKHITVLEEAHNILKRCSHETSQDSGNVQGASVGMLVDCIAEMRSCGEGMMIIDQSPGAVDEAALKNTAIKIVMRLPEKSDCEAIGSTLSLRDDQIRELSRLDVGVAAVFHVGWEETVLGKMGTIWKNTTAAKAYHIVATPVNRNDLLRTKGALCQWLCAKLVEEDLDDLNDMSALESFIRSYISEGYAKTINANLWQDIRLQLNQFIKEVKGRIGNLDSLSSNDIGEFRNMLGRFLRSFLQIDGIFRINRLVLPTYEPKRVVEPSDKEIAAIDAWWETMTDILSKYVIMPLNFGTKPLRWSSNTMDGQYIRTALQVVLRTYALEYTKAHNGDSKYECAYLSLRKEQLKEKGTRRR